MADADIEMRRTILQVIQKRIDTGVLAAGAGAAGAGLEDHTAGAAKPKRVRKAKAKAAEPVVSAEEVEVVDESSMGGKRKRKAKGGSALDRPTLQVTGSTDGGKKPESAWVKEIKAVQKAKGCTYGEAMRLASEARKKK